jgi:2-desacetyl-2-hydroxyethyl bacteriochlorophyllide A dehydrogenase
VVVEVNERAYEQWLGRRVGVQAYRACGSCAFCMSGRENLCPNTVHMGHAQGWGSMDFYPGAYAEYALAWGDLLFALPEQVPSAEAALADVLCVGVHAVGRARATPGATVVIGGGPVGLVTAQVAHARGAEEVYVIEPAPAARAVLERYASVRLEPPARGTAAAVFDTVGSSETLAQGVELLAASGTLVNIAVHDAPLAWNAVALGSERSVTTSSNAHYRDVAEAYELISSGRVSLGPMITHRFGLEGYAEAFELLLSTPKRAYKVVLEPGTQT